MLSQSSLAFGGLGSNGLLAGKSNAHGSHPSGNSTQAGDSQTEDARDGYSSQRALAEPSVVRSTGASTKRALVQEQPTSQDSLKGGSGESSQSQEDTMSPVFGRAPKRATARWRRGVNEGSAAVREQEHGGEVVGNGGHLTMEMSHVNREPCMRSLLLVVDVERKLFGEGWLARVEQSEET